jgi:ATP-dependent Lon protease
MMMKSTFDVVHQGSLDPHIYYPLISLDKQIIYPHQVITCILNQTANRNALFSLDSPHDSLIVVFNTRSNSLSYPTPISIGVEVRVISYTHLGREQDEVVLQGIQRVDVVDIVGEGEYLEDEKRSCSFGRAKVDVLKTEHIDNEQLIGINQILRIYENLARTYGKVSENKVSILRAYQDQPERFVDLLLQNIKIERDQALTLFEKKEQLDRINAVHDWIQSEEERLIVESDIEKRTKIEAEISRREYYLRQQIKTIRKELGEENHSEDEADRYAALLSDLPVKDDIFQEIKSEIDRLKHISPSSSEFQVIKTYLDRIFALPWGEERKENIDLPRVRKALESQHFGLKKVKERILESLAVRKLNPTHKGSILCFVGPPGVGKTSLGKAIADSIGRQFFRISMGGVRDEAEIRGHRRTYVGAMPGKILNGLSRANCNNPLMILDEIDKISSDQRGDPASALLEVLDPEQNHSFTDHYFNIPFDLSKILFIATANYLHDIPKPLLDRLEVISIEGYTESEKIQIAQTHLLPRILSDHGLEDQALKWDETALQTVVQGWTREAGVRNLRRALQKVCRKVVRLYVEEDIHIQSITSSDVSDYLGPERFQHDFGIGNSCVGAANGLAWTASGGELLVIEALKMKGHGKLVITGKLGEVMKESVQAAHSFIRSRAHSLGISDEVFEKEDIHIHFPAGAVPKDGPSAGVTVTLALASLLSNKAVRADFAMTGEVTLRGKVLAVGGIKDKVLAAYRAGIAHIALPKLNSKDLDELPQEVSKAVQFHPLDHVDELLQIALVDLTDLTPN